MHPMNKPSITHPKGEVRYRERSVVARIRSRRYHADETPYPVRTT